jgi:hypothetical protein
MTDPLFELAIMWIGVFFASLLAAKTKLTSVLYFLAFGGSTLHGRFQFP